MTSNPITVNKQPMVPCDCEIDCVVNGRYAAACTSGFKRPIQAGDTYTGQCPDCEGDGFLCHPAEGAWECPACVGSGQVTGTVTGMRDDGYEVRLNDEPWISRPEEPNNER